jgi:hypothetical protein
MRAPGAATLCCYVLPPAWLSSCSIMGGQGLRPARRRWLMSACSGDSGACLTTG